MFITNLDDANKIYNLKNKINKNRNNIKNIIKEINSNNEQYNVLYLDSKQLIKELELLQKNKNKLNKIYKKLNLKIRV